MTGLPSLLGALGLVALLFALVSFLVALLGVPTNLSWILSNLGVGVVMLGTAAAMNFDGLRERMHSGEAKRAGRYGSTAILGTVISIGILGMLGFLAERYHVRWDWSEQQVHSLSDQSVKVLAGLDRDVQVVALFSAIDLPPIRALLDRYEYASDRFTVVEFADPNARPDLLAKYEITPEKLGNGVLRVALGDESVELAEVTEENLTNAMVKLSRTTEKKVYFLEGHNERAIEGPDASGKDGYSRAAAALRNENYRVEKLLLAAKGEVPDDADVVIASGPTRPLLRQERAALRSYLARGGALMLLVDPRANTDLIEDVREWGANVGDDIVVDRQLAVFGRATTPFAGKYASDHAITKDLRETTLFPVVRSVSAGDGAASDMTEIVFTSEDSWAERDLERFFAEGAAEYGDDDLRGPVPIAVAGSVDLRSGREAEADAPDGDDDLRGPVPIAVAGSVDLSGGSEAEAGAPDGEDENQRGRLVVFGDADFAGNEMVDAYLNRDLFVNAVNWLLGDIEAIAVRPNRSRASRFQPTAKEFQNIRLLSLFVLPEALAVLGVFTWWWRRQIPGA